MNVPRLRFKDVDGQEFSAWKEKPLQEVCKINQGLQIPISERFTDKGEGRHFYITNEFLKKDSNVQYFIENPPSSVLCSESDVLMTRTGNTGKVVTGVNGAFHNNFFKINYDKEALNKNFLCEFLSREKTQFLILKLAGTSTIPDLNHSDFYKITIQFPFLPEQTKIANFLTAIDEKITQLTQKYDLLKQYKKGVMQQIFSQKLRFKDGDGREFPEWEEKKLKDTAQIVGGGTPETGIKEYWNGNIQWFTPTELKSKYAARSQRTITESGFKNSSAKILPVGALLFSSRATVGDISIALNPCTTNQGFQSLIVNDRNSNEFIYYWILNNKKAFLEKACGSTFLEISKKEIEKLSIQRPDIKEQTKIANFLTAIDDKITHTQIQLNAVKLYKKGLLQQMFV